MEKVEVNTNLEYSRRKLADLKEYEGNGLQSDGNSDQSLPHS